MIARAVNPWTSLNYAKEKIIQCLLHLGPHRRRLTRRRLPGRPHISTDTFSRHSAFCKVSIMCHLVRNVLKFLRPCLQRTDIIHHAHLWLNPTVHVRFFNFSLGPMIAHGAPNARQYANPSSHHTTSRNGYIHPEPTTTYPYALSPANTIAMGPAVSTWTRDSRSLARPLLAGFLASPSLP